MDVERTIEFVLEQQAASQARFDARMAELDTRMQARTERAEREIDQIRQELRRAVRLSVLEARAERKRRSEEDVRLAASQEELRKSLQAFIDSMKQPRNGHDQN